MQSMFIQSSIKTGFCSLEEDGMFNIRMALECNGHVFKLNLNRIENGVIYFQLEDASVQIQPESQGDKLVDAEGGQPEETQTLSPGAEEGAEAVPQHEDSLEGISSAVPRAELSQETAAPAAVQKRSPRRRPR
jgi:hypothetical protein